MEKIKLCIMYKQVIEKRLERKKEQLNKLSDIMNSGGVLDPSEKRKYVELKAVIMELENVLDIAETMFEQEVKPCDEK